MPASTIITSNFLCHLRIPTEQPVRQCRFSHARGAEKGDSAIALEISFENVHAIARAHADRMNWHVRRDPLDLAGQANNIIHKVGLVDHNHRSGTTLLNQSQIKLYPQQIIIAAQRSALARGKTTSIEAGPSPSDRSTATKSPTPGKSERCAEVFRVPPLVTAESSVASVAIL
jgi:hypothetical protein